MRPFTYDVSPKGGGPDPLPPKSEIGIPPLSEKKVG